MVSHQAYTYNVYGCVASVELLLHLRVIIVFPLFNSLSSFLRFTLALLSLRSLLRLVSQRAALKRFPSRLDLLLSWKKSSTSSPRIYTCFNVASFNYPPVSHFLCFFLITPSREISTYRRLPKFSSFSPFCYPYSCLYRCVFIEIL